MLVAVHPVLPMRDKKITKDYYTRYLGFTALYDEDDRYKDYLMLKKDQIEIHFFLFRELDVKINYGICYIRTTEVDNLYQQALHLQLDIPELGHLKDQPWFQREFALRDPDANLLTFGMNISKA
jgi:catechol 2,3-dioxygenase-like lactoylglutathione lyase family enzyme